jgi:predicted nucleic acid-binding protein
MDEFNLDFDEASQYLAAEQNNMVMVRFDNDFDKTGLGKNHRQEFWL